MRPLNELEFLVAFLPFERRRLTRTGVEIHCLQFWADALEPWVGQKLRVDVHYDPRDITFVYVRTPGGVLVKALVTTRAIEPISLVEWEARRQHERSLSRSPERLAMRDASQRRADDIVQQAKVSQRVRRRRATEAAGDRFRDVSTPTAPVVSSTSTELVESMTVDFAIKTYAIEGENDEFFS